MLKKGAEAVVEAAAPGMIEKIGKMAIGGAIGGAIGFFLGIGLLYATGITGAANAIIIGSSLLGIFAGAIVAHERDINYTKLGLTPPPIHIRMLEEEVEEGEKRAVLELTNFKIIDVKAIKYAIDQNRDKTKPGYDFSQEPSYSIKIKLKNPNIMLAQLDYSDWGNNPNFTVEVTQETEGQKVPVDAAKRQEVLNSLNIIPKFLGDTFDHPADKVLEKMTPSSNLRAGKLGKVGGVADTVINLAKYLITGKVAAFDVKVAGGPSEKIEKPEFIEELADVAMKTGNYSELFSYYEKTITNSHTAQLLIAEQNKRAEENYYKGFPGIKTFIGLGLATLLLFGLALACIFPPAGLALGAAATFGLAVAGYISLGLSFITSIASLFTGYFTYKQRTIKKAMTAIKAKQQTIAAEINQKFVGLDATNTELETLTKSQGKELILENKNIGDYCAIIISKWITSNAASHCETLRLGNPKFTAEDAARYHLANNIITAEGAARIAKAITKAPNIKTVDLRGNPINAAGIEAFSKTLAANITLTNFLYDEAQIQQKTRDAIRKQLLINNYLQNTLPPHDPRIAKYFGNQDNLERAAIDKISKIERLESLVISEKSSDPIKKAVCQKQLQMLFGKDVRHDSRSLAYYLAIRQNINPEELSKVDPKVILKTIQASLLSDKDQKFNLVPNLGSQALLKLTDRERTDLLAKSLAAVSKDEHAYGIAYLTSQLINFPGVFDPSQSTRTIQKIRQCLEPISNWGTEHQSTFNEHIRELRILKSSLLGDAAHAQEIATIEQLMQNSLQEDLTNRFACLREPFGITDLEKLKIDLQTNYELRGFKFPDKVALETRQYIENILIRNRLHEARDSIANFVAIYSQIPQDQIRSHLENFRNIPDNQEALIQLIKSDMETEPKYSALTKLDSVQRTELLASSLAGSDPQNAQGIAVLVSGLIDIKDELERDEYIWRIFSWASYAKWDFDEYIANVKKLKNALALKNKLLADRIEQILQTALQVILKNEFSCLKEQDKINDLDKLKEKLERNFDLRSMESLETDAAPEAKKHLEVIVSRNRYFDVIHANLQVLSGIADREQRLSGLRKFIADFKKHPEWQKSLSFFLIANNGANQLQVLIDENPLSIIALRDLSGEEIGTLFMTIYGEAADARSAQYLEIALHNLPQDLDTDQFRGVIANLHNSFKNLNQDIIPALKEQRRSLIKSGMGKDKIGLIKAFDQAIFHQELQGDYNSEQAKQFRLIKLVEDYPTTRDTLHLFVDLYVTVDLARLDFNRINYTKLKALVMQDDFLHKYPLLRNLDEPKIAGLLASCLRDDIHAHGIATLAAKLIKFESDLVKPEYIWAVFDQPGSFLRAKHDHWTFKKYIGELKKLIDLQPSLTERINAIIQDGIQTDLSKRFDCLNGVTNILPDNLQEELEDNFDLTSSTGFKYASQGNEVAKYVEFICERNLLHKHITQLNLNEFVITLNELPVKFPHIAIEEVLQQLDKAKILQMLTKDLGKQNALTCEQLRFLQPKIREALLTHCFAIEPSEAINAHKKAILLSKMLEIDELFAGGLQPSSKIIQDLSYQVYWALSVEGSSIYGRSGIPYYKYQELASALTTLSRKIPATDKVLERPKQLINDALKLAAAAPEVRLTAAERIEASKG